MGEFNVLPHENELVEGEDIAMTEGSGLGVEDGVLGGSLRPLSYHVVRLRV